LLLPQCEPILFESFLDFFKTDEFYGFDTAKIMAVVITMLVIVADYPPVVSVVQKVVDRSKVVARELEFFRKVS